MKSWRLDENRVLSHWDNSPEWNTYQLGFIWKEIHLTSPWESPQKYWSKYSTAQSKRAIENIRRG